MIHHQGAKAWTRGRSLRWEWKPRPQRSPAYWSAPELVPSYLSYTAQTHLPKSSIAHVGWALHPLEVKEMPHRQVHTPSGGSISLQLEVCSSSVTLVSVKLVEANQQGYSVLSTGFGHQVHTHTHRVQGTAGHFRSRPMYPGQDLNSTCGWRWPWTFDFTHLCALQVRSCSATMPS